MYVYKRPSSKYWSTKFQLDGTVYRVSTGETEKRKAESRAYELYRERCDAARCAAAAEDAPLTLGAAWDKWKEQKSGDVSNAADLDNDMMLITTEFRDAKGKLIIPAHRLLTSITHDDVFKLREWRRGHYRWNDESKGLIANRTVNQTIEVLRRVFVRAEEKWGITFDPKTKPQWDEILLETPRERVRVLSADENHALADEMDHDYLEVFDYALAAGLRMDNCLVRWSNFDLKNNMFQTIGKGGKEIRRMLTAREREIVERHRGEHDEFVFTYMAQKTTKGRIVGKRYPITYEGLKTHFRRARARAVIKAPTLMSGDRSKNFRWHDTRHTFATTLLNTPGANIKTVQRALNHSRIETTMKYVHVFDDELANAMNAAHDTMKDKFKRKGAGK